MLASITPLGERGRRSRWPLTVTAYAVASVAAAAALGTGLGLLGAAVPLPGRPAVLVAGLLAGAAADATGLAPRGPRRQVNEDWLARYRGWVYGAGFGAQLGVGIATIIPTAAVLGVGLAAFLAGRPAAGAVIGAVFGLARAAPVLGLRRVDTPAALHRAFRGLERGRRAAGRATVAGQAALGLLGLATLVAAGWPG